MKSYRSPSVVKVMVREGELERGEGEAQMEKETHKEEDTRGGGGSFCLLCLLFALSHHNLRPF